ncbi:MAG: DUF1326 domain-containing protein [Gammaproteobacteria bacterium]|jgi:hypothetical protein
MAYHLEGDLLEVCTCETLCPCWVGDDPDGGTCDSSLAYHIRSGQIDGVDVSGLTWVGMVHIPGNVLDGNWKAINYLDEKATAEQEAALRRVFHGEAGGPMADLAQLVSEVVDVRRAPIVCDVEKGKGRFSIGDVVEADLEPFIGPDDEPTKLVGSIFSTIPGSPAYVGKATRYRQKSAELDQDIDITGHNAISGPFVFDYREAA